MATRFSIEAVYRALDRMTAPQRKMERSNKRFTKALKTDFAKAQRSIANFGSSVKKHLVQGLKTAAIIGIGTLALGLGIASKQFVDFAQTITEAGARFKDVQIGSDAAKKTLEELRQAARDAGATTQFTAVESAEALDFFARAGFTSAEAMAILQDQIDLATVAGEDFARVADISSDLLGAFGLAVSNSAQKIENLKNLNNALGIATNMANVTIEDLFETLKTAAPIGTAAGENMNELIAITAALGNAGIKGSLGATALKNAYIRLAAPTKKVNEALWDIGLSTKDFIDKSGKMKSMVDIMKLLGERTKDLGQAEQLRIFAEIFGKRAVAGALNISKSLNEINTIFNELEGDKKIKDIADEIRKGLGLRIKILISSLLELGFKFIEAFEKNGAGAIEFLTKAIQSFDPKPIIKGIKTTVSIFIKFFKAIKPFKPFIMGIIIAFAAYKAVMLIAAAAQMLFNFALSANPIGIVIILVGLLIGVIILLVKNFDKVKAAVIAFSKAALEWLINVGKKTLEIFDKIKGVAALIAPPFIFFIEILRSIIEHWDEIKKAFSEGGIIGGIMAIGKAVLSGLLSPVQSLLELLAKIPGLEELALGGAQKIAQLREGLFEGEGETTAPISPSERSTLIREERTEKGELIINDKTNRAEVKKDFKTNKINLKITKSGAF